MRFAIAVAAFAATAFAQEADVYVTATPRGDVSLTIFSTLEDAPVLPGIVLATMKCKLPGLDDDPSYLSGMCPHMLASRAGLAKGTVNFAGLAIALHAAGEQTVTINIQRGGSLQASGANWHEAERGTGRRKSEFLQFTSRSTYEIPSPVEIRVGHEVNAAGLLPPLFIVLFIPGLIALWLERRRNAGALVWLNWILLACWLYWMSAINITDVSAFAGSLDIHPAIGLLMGAAFYSVPPLVAMASCMIALTPRLLPGSHRFSELARLLRRTVGGMAAVLAPLGLFLVGTGMFEYSRQVGMGSMLGAFILWRALSWWAARGSFREMRAIDRGEFFDRVMALARKAGVGLKKIYLVRTRLAREANAFALPGGRVAITESLLRGLSRREVDAVMAHELGHLKGRHVTAKSGFYWIFFLLAGPAVEFVARVTGLPGWFRSLPIAAAVFTLAMAYISQRHEFSADARAAEITGDPEAKIAALARLARLTSSPLDWGGIQGSILSHPSMKARVLSIARRSGVPEFRALELLDNPDLLESGVARLGAAVDPASLHYALPPDLEKRDPVFNSTAKAVFHRRSSWMEEMAIVVLLLGLAFLLGRVFPLTVARKEILAFLAGLPVTFWMILRFDNWLRGRFYSGLREKIRPRMDDSGGIFVGLLPGETVVRTEGCGEWDLGFLFLRSDRLIYRGERAEFSLTRAQILNLSMEAGPFSWSHPHRVMVQWSGGWFSVQRPELRRSRRQGQRLLKEMQAWRDGTVLARGDAPALPPPNLPAIMGDHVPKATVAVWVVKNMAIMLFGCTILLAASGGVVLYRSMPLLALIPFTAPLLWLANAWPAIIMRRPKKRDAMNAPAPDAVRQIG